MDPKISNPNGLTRDQIEAGLNELKNMYPEDAANIELHADTILSAIVDGVEIPKDHPIYSVPNSLPLAPETTAQSFLSTPCGTATKGACAEAAVFLFTVAGLPSVNRLGDWIVRGLVPMAEYSSAFTPLWQAFTTAEGAIAKAKAFAPIAMKLWKTNAVRIVIDVVKSKSTWADFILDAAIVVAQLVVWVASEFIAMIAQAALTILQAAHLVSTIKDTVATCKDSTAQTGQLAPATLASNS